MNNENIANNLEKVEEIIQEEALKFEDAYKKKIGKVTFWINPIRKESGNYTAEQLILQMLEERVKAGTSP